MPPSLKFTQDQWDMVKAQYDAVDGDQAFKAAFVAPGLFEQTHHLRSEEHTSELQSQR